MALEVGLGVAMAGAAALVTMKHVGLNVAADPLFTAAYTGTSGPLVIVSADDPGMASSQNEQDNRRFAVAAAVPMLEPADAQESYDFTLLALELSARWHLPFILRTTTRVCHSKTVVCPQPRERNVVGPHFERDIRGRVMIPSNARPAHRRLRQKLAELAQWNEEHGPSELVAGQSRLGIVTSGVSFMHVREAAPDASVLKLGLTYPLPLEKIRRFAAGVERCLVIEEGDPYLVEQLRAAGIAVEGKPEMYRFGELNVARVRRIVAGDTSPEAGRGARQAADLVPGLPAPHRFRRAEEARLHRGGRHRLLFAGGAAAVGGDGLAGLHGRQHRHGPGAPPRPARRRGPARRQRHRRQHVRSQRHPGPGGDGLQSAARRPRRADPRQQHDGHDRPARASRHRADARPRRDRQDRVRGPGPIAGHPERHGRRPRGGAGGVRAGPGRKPESRRPERDHHAANVPAGCRQDPGV